MICGNKEVISTLENYLEIAKKNPIGYISIVMAGPNNLGVAESAGSNLLQEIARKGLNCLIEEMDKSIDIYALPKEREDLDASYVCYNAIVGPHSYEFINWLVDAEMTRIEEECEPPLKVGFWQGKGNKLKPGQEGYKWLNDVFRPALKLINAVEDDKALYGRHKKLYGVRDINYLSKNFFRKVPKLISSMPKPDFMYDVTFTVNEYTNDWLKFQDYLEEKGNKTIIIPTFAEIPYRLSFYENAKCNLFDNNEFHPLALFGSRPWLRFQELNSKNFTSSPMGWELLNGFPVGEQYPWALDNQRIVWESPTYNNLVSAWDASS